MSAYAGRWIGLLLSCLLLAACGEEAESDAPLTQAGGVGTSTLMVRMDIVAQNRVANAQSTDDFDTYLTVRIEQGGERVPDALVSLGRSDGGSPRTLVPNEQLLYSGDHVGYVPRYTLDVQRADDLLSGVTVTLPSVHQISEPQEGSSVDAAQGLTVRWEPSGEADWVEVSLGNQEWELLGDPGELNLDADELAPLVSEGAADALTLSVRRGRRFALEGGLAGSRVYASVDNSLKRIGVRP